MLRKERKRLKYEQLKQNGHCVNCGKYDSLEKITLCLICWFKNSAKKNLGSRKHWLIIKNIWDEQEGLCKYSKEKLIPGFNASLDHKIPTSKGGTDDKENLQWITKEWNTLKWNRTEEEMIVHIIEVNNVIINFLKILKNTEQGNSPS
jgi:hypothetical protein